MLVLWCRAAAWGAAPELVGHWKLQGDCRDYSGQGNHGVNHGVDLANGEFNGASAYIEVPASKSLKLGASDFAFSAWINTPAELDDVVGDVFDMYDPAARRGVTLSINSSAGGYQSQGTDRHVHFGVDNAKTSEWEDCGRPNPTSNYVSNSLTVYKGKLYAATMDAADEGGWCHVYRYDGGQKWTDCGRVGAGKTTGVGPLLVHDGDLYAATSTYDWTRVADGDYEPGRVYRYAGGKEWKECGQPGDARTLNSMASYKGKLYAGGGPQTWGVFVRGDDHQWSPSKIFSKDGPQRCFPHAMCRHNGRLFVGFPGVYSFDGAVWTFAGQPAADTDGMLQTHSMQLYQGRLHAGTWPKAKVVAYEDGESWQEIGRVGEDGTEVNALVVYNGKFYGGSIPRAEVCRYDDAPSWTSLKRFYSPENWDPGVPGQASREQVKDWSRVTSLTVHDGRLFASTGSCTSSVEDAPLDVRGKVFSMEAGKVASYSADLGAGWKHLAAVREGGRLKLYINGKLAAGSSEFDPAEYDVSTDRPLRIGFGQSDYFDGKMKDVRLYSTALSESQVQKLHSQKHE
ncbi:MAG: LamG domain-containing protein [Pirellulales bacterium]|nr:LamG domain-containing protein [Pirellulales bacterium]